MQRVHSQVWLEGREMAQERIRGGERQARLDTVKEKKKEIKKEQVQTTIDFEVKKLE